MPITIGLQAPEFTLHDSDKQPVSLSDFKGKNVLIFFFLKHLREYVLKNYVVLEMVFRYIIKQMLKF
jgi:hypothetical protein